MCKGPEAGMCLEYRSNSKRFSVAEEAWVWEVEPERYWWDWGPGPYRVWEGPTAFNGNDT